MSDTPITDRAKEGINCAHKAKELEAVFAALAKMAELERMCEELAAQLQRSTPLLPKWPDVLIAKNWAALARYEAMKKGGV